MSQAPNTTHCPDWQALVARRDQDETGERLFDEALEHFDACSDCRAAACDAEPTLVFRRLPTTRVETAEIDAVRQAVHAMRRGRALEAAPQEQPAGASRSRRARAPSWRMTALAATLLLALGGVSLLQLGGGDGAPEVRAAAPASEILGETRPAPPMSLPAALSDLELEGLPLVEDLDPALGTLIELHDDEVSIVMVVADPQEGFDV